jgi:hypothetical protein
MWITFSHQALLRVEADEVLYELRLFFCRVLLASGGLAWLQQWAASFSGRFYRE